MSIRSTVKAIILHENKILLNICHSPENGTFYAFPGGGQEKYEAMEEAIVRECLEETGYKVVPEAFVALYEEIHISEAVREKYPVHAHKIFHIFRCTLSDALRGTPTGQDSNQVDCVWVDIEDVPGISLRPACVHERIGEIITTASPLFLGTNFIDADWPT